MPTVWIQGKEIKGDISKIVIHPDGKIEIVLNTIVKEIPRDEKPIDLSISAC
jgi:hypothetical protein